MGLLLTRCPANRDGMPGQLAQAVEETTGAARSGALALDQWTQRRSTAQLTSVQLADARDEVVKAYKGIADLRADDPVDLDRQRMLTSSMTAIIGQLNAAAGTVRNITTEPIDAGSHPVGTVIDVRLTIAGDLDHDPATPRVLGLIISPRTTSSFLGYERSTEPAPYDAGPTAALAAPRHLPGVMGGHRRVAEGQVTLRPQLHQTFSCFAGRRLTPGV